MKKLVSALLLLFLAAPLPLMAADLVETRKANFKQNAAILKAVRDQISMEEWQELADGAQKIADWANDMLDYFPASATSRGALPAIWENFDDFKSKASANHQAALALRDAALSQDSDAVMGAVRTVGGTCKSCHSSYKAD